MYHYGRRAHIKLKVMAYIALVNLWYTFFFSPFSSVASLARCVFRLFLFGLLFCREVAWRMCQKMNERMDSFFFLLFFVSPCDLLWARVNRNAPKTPSFTAHWLHKFYFMHIFFFGAENLYKQKSAHDGIDHKALNYNALNEYECGWLPFLIYRFIFRNQNDCHDLVRLGICKARWCRIFLASIIDARARVRVHYIIHYIFSSRTEPIDHRAMSNDT